jgi:hypothetical protein
MPEAVRRCRECKAFQDVRRFIPGSEVVLALLVALISVLSAAVPLAYRAWNYRSDTTVYLLGAADSEKAGGPVVMVAVTNDGLRPAVVQEAIKLSWETPPIPLMTSTLRILNPQSRIVLPGQTSVLELTGAGVGVIGKPTPTDVEQALLTGNAIVTLGIDQTSRLGCHAQEYSQARVKASMLETWLKGKVGYSNAIAN